MTKQILLIEDDEKKIDDIKSFIISNHPNVCLDIQQSYQSGLRKLMTGNIDYLLLDMSLPTWDSAEYESIGSFEKFGGFKIMKEMLRKKNETKTIMITMFDDFGESDSSITLKQIDDMLKSSFESFYVGYVFYNSRENSWKDKLSGLFTSLGI